MSNILTGLRAALRWASRLTLLLLVLLATAFAAQSLGRPRSTLMLARALFGRPVERDWVPLRAISPHLARAVILSEDGQFCRHHGVDWGAIREVVARRGGPSRGASTITMQLAKNLFLWPARSYLRKAVEIPLALLLDALWSKKAILEAYLNVAQWGDGVFGAEAASRHAFGKGAAELSAREAALLATALPNPILRSPAHPSRAQSLLAARIVRLAGEAGAHASCVE